MLLIRSWSPRDVGGLASEADRFGTNTIRGEYVTGRIRHSEGAPATEESRAWVGRLRYCHGVNALSAD